jgi:hypothetical protein
MPLTSTEYSRRRREKIKQDNPEKYKQLRHDENQKYYKKIKEPNEENEYEDIGDDEIDEENEYNEIDEENEYNEIEEEIEYEEIEEENEYEEIEDDNNNNKIKIPKYLIDLNIINIDNSGFIIYKPLKKRIKTLNKSILQPQSIKLYYNSFNKIYKNYTKTELSDIFKTELLKLLSNDKYNIKIIKKELEFLKKDLYNFIKPLTKNELQYLYSILTRIIGYAPIIKKIYPYMLQRQIEYQQSRANKELKDINYIKYNKLSFNIDDVLQILNHFNDNKIEGDKNYLTSRDKLIFGLFMLLPVRRPIDYLRMMIINKEPLTEDKILIHKRNNYYYNKTFYYNRTKTKEIQKITVPDELDILIKNYINDRISGCLLLDNNNKQYNSSNLSIHIMKIFSKIYDISISAVELRHYYSTYINYLVKQKELTEKEHRKICDMMNHSYEENKKYAYCL